MLVCENSPSGLTDESGVAIGWQSTRGNWKVMVSGIECEASRVIWEITYGAIPDGMIVDHKNRDASDNKISNLRIVTQAVNTRNRTKSVRNKSGTTGVYHNVKRDRFEVTWREGGKTKSKSFSINVLGSDAENLAIVYRKEQIDRLNGLGYGYSDSHGI